MAEVEKDLLQPGEGQQNLPALFTSTTMSTSPSPTSSPSPAPASSLNEGEAGVGNTRVSSVSSCSSASEEGLVGSDEECGRSGMGKSFCSTENRYSFSLLKVLPPSSGLEVAFVRAVSVVLVLGVLVFVVLAIVPGVALPALLLAIAMAAEGAVWIL